MNVFKTIKNITRVCFYITLVIIIESCGDIFNKDEYEITSIEATPSLSVPFAFGDLSIADILSQQDSQYIKVYPDGVVYLSYDQVLKSQDVRNLISIPDKTNVNANLNVPPGFYPAVNSDYNSTQISQFVTFDIAPALLDEILLKGGALSCDAIMSPANPNFKFAVKISIPEFTLSGTNTPFSIEVGGTTGQSFSLANYLFKSAVPNRITLEYTLIIKQNPNAVTILPGTVISTNSSFTNMRYKYALGFFGDQIADLPAETLDINAFGASLGDVENLSFAEPKMEFKVVNDVGVPTKVYFSSLEARKRGSSLAVQISPSSPITISFPAVLGDSATTMVAVNNVNALLNFAPTQFYYKMKARINEGLNSGNNFVADTSLLRVTLHVEIPLYGHASNIKLADTLDIGLSDADRSEIVDAALKVKTNNQIPLAANLQFYLADSTFQILDSLLLPEQTNLIKSSQVNASGELASEGAVDTKIPLSKEKLQKLLRASKLIIKARINTTKDDNGVYPDVKFKSSYKMSIKLGLEVNAKLKIKL